jgi:hypothetical protein
VRSVPAKHVVLPKIVAIIYFSLKAVPKVESFILSNPNFQQPAMHSHLSSH